MASKKKKKSPISTESKIIAVVSDIHFDLHHVPAWNAFMQWHADVKPHKTIVLGDFVDLGMMSQWKMGTDDPVYAVPQIRACIEQMNILVKQCDELIMMEGNHDERWDKVVKSHGPALKGALGLTLREQFFSQGLDPAVTYMKEDTKNKGVRVGNWILRHGHRQGRGWGPKHLAYNRLVNNMFENEIFGHYHKAQMFAHTANGRTATAIANPCLTGDHDYATDPQWQRGFTVVELYGPDNMYSNARPIVMNDGGHFAYNGKVYGGK